jgi:transcriptional regulator with XRE-family HTH domain
MVVQLLEGLRQAQGLTKIALAQRLGITPRSYRNWMLRASTLQAAEVARLVEALGMTAETRATLYTLTGQLPPAPAVSELRRTPEMALYQSMIDGLEHPSVVYTDSWDVVLCNQAFREVFGSVRAHISAHPTRNTNRFIFFHPDASILLGGGDATAFREHWLMPAFAHFAATLQQRLLAIEREVNERPALRRAYRRTPGWIAEHGDIAISPSARPFWDPRVGRLVHAHVITEAHQGYQATTLQRATFILRDPQPKAVTAGFEQRALFELEAEGHIAGVVA